MQAVKLLGYDTRKQAGSETIGSGASLGSSVYVSGETAFQLGVQSGTGEVRATAPQLLPLEKAVFKMYFKTCSG